MIILNILFMVTWARPNGDLFLSRPGIENKTKEPPGTLF